MVEIHIAIARAAIRDAETIGPGIRLEPTYAHVFAHPMLAVRPPLEPNSHHPTPWTAVTHSGFIETATVQLTLNTNAKVLSEVDFYHARSVTSLLRLICSRPIRAPIWSNVRFADIAGGSQAIVQQFEPPLQWPMNNIELSLGATAALRKLLPLLEARRQDEKFETAFVLLDSMWWIPTLSAQLIAIWSSAEALMQPSRVSMTKDLARLTREALGKSPSHGDRIYNDVIRLCEARGAAAHAGREPAPMDVQASFRLVRDLMVRSLEGQ